MQYILMLGWLSCLTLANPPPAYGPVCSQPAYNVLSPVAEYGPAATFCQRRFAVAAATETTTYTPTSTSLQVVTVLRTSPFLTASIVTKLVTQTTGTTYLDKRDATPAAAPLPSASLSRYWNSASSSLSRRGTAAFSTACSCIQTAKMVKATVTARTLIVKSTTTTTKYTTLALVVDRFTTKTLNVQATVFPGPGSCSNVKSPYTDGTVSGSSKQYNTFCKQALTASSANTINSVGDVIDFKSCMEKCSSTTNCVAVNYVRRMKLCTLLKDTSGTPSTNDDTDSAQVNADEPSIPLPVDSNGDYIPPNSKFAFQVATNKVFSYAASDLTKSLVTTDFASCIDQCSTTDRCVMVSRSRSSKMCLMFQKVLTAGSPVSKLRVRQDTSGTTPSDSDSATNVIAPDQTCSAFATASQSQIGADDGQQPYKVAMRIKCNAFNPAVQSMWLDKIAGSKNLQQCADSCAQNKKCVAANFYHNTFECWLANATLWDWSQTDDGITRPSQIDAIQLYNYKPPATDCNTLSSSTFTDQSTSRIWNLKCGASLDPNGDNSKFLAMPSGIPSFKECIYNCANLKDCAGVDYDENNRLCTQYRAGVGFQGNSPGHDIAVIRQGATSAAGTATISATFVTQSTKRGITEQITTTQAAGHETSPDDGPHGGRTTTTQIAGAGTSPVEGPQGGPTTTSSSSSSTSTSSSSPTPSPDPPPPCVAGNQTSAGRSFQVLCNSWLPESDFTVLETTATNEMADCISACTNRDDCVAVDLHPAQSQCLSLGNAKNFDYYFTKPGRMDTQFAMQTSPDPRVCGGVPQAQTYHAAGSVDFQIRCNTDIRWERADNIDIYSGLQTTTFQECLDTCAQDWRCTAVNWLGPPDPGYTKAACNILNAVNHTIGSTIMAAMVVSRPPTSDLVKYSPCTPDGTGELYSYPGRGGLYKGFQIVRLDDYAYSDDVIQRGLYRVFQRNASSWEDCAYSCASSGACGYVQFDTTNSTSYNCAGTTQEPHDVRQACVARPGWIAGRHPDVVLS